MRRRRRRPGDPRGPAPTASSGSSPTSLPTCPQSRHASVPHLQRSVRKWRGQSSLGRAQPVRGRPPGPAGSNVCPHRGKLPWTAGFWQWPWSGGGGAFDPAETHGVGLPADEAAFAVKPHWQSPHPVEGFSRPSAASGEHGGDSAATEGQMRPQVAHVMLDRHVLSNTPGVEPERLSVFGQRGHQHAFVDGDLAPPPISLTKSRVFPLYTSPRPRHRSTSRSPSSV